MWLDPNLKKKLHAACVPHPSFVRPQDRSSTARYRYPIRSRNRSHSAPCSCLRSLRNPSRDSRGLLHSTSIGASRGLTRAILYPAKGYAMLQSYGTHCSQSSSFGPLHRVRGGNFLGHYPRHGTNSGAHKPDDHRWKRRAYSGARRATKFANAVTDSRATSGRCAFSGGAQRHQWPGFCASPTANPRTSRLRADGRICYSPIAAPGQQRAAFGLPQNSMATFSSLR